MQNIVSCGRRVSAEVGHKPTQFVGTLAATIGKNKDCAGRHG